jgi:HlyD family secretion protein
MPVTIRWDAMPERRWEGTVDRVPTEIVTLGTRHVGEVGVVIDNPDNTLLPGTNVDAEIHSSVVQNALSIPKETIRREGAQTGVLKLNGDSVAWQPVKTGVASITRLQVLSGLNEGDAVALPTDKPIKAGDDVKPVFR